MLYGYGGRILRVDLTTGKILRDHSDPSYLKKAIGGRGLNLRRLMDEAPRDAQGMAPENMLLMAVGPLTGTLLTASAPMTMSGISPLNNLPGHAQVGGFLGPELKVAGYDQVIVTGRSEKPCYLLIADDQVEIRDAGHLWGLETGETTTALRRELNDNALQVAAIGPAGENLVKFAAMASNNTLFGGTMGLGWLFGSKQLKAVAVRGTGLVNLADTLGFLDLCRSLDQRIMSHPSYEPRRRMGSTRLMTVLHDLGILPTRHFQKGVCDDLDRISGKRLAMDYGVKPKGCFNCNLNCSNYYVAGDFEGNGPDFDALCSYTSRLGNDDPGFALRINTYLTGMGLDPVSSGETIGWTMECVQRDLLTKDDLDGLDFTWGNQETIPIILDLITRRQGVGDWFAEGVQSLARRYGGEAEKYAMQVRGVPMACGDPRGLKALGLAAALGSGDGDPLGMDTLYERVIGTGSTEQAETAPAVDRLADEGQAALVDQVRQQTLLADCLTICRDIGSSMGLMDTETAARLLTAGTGVTFSPERLDRILGRLIDDQRRLALEMGLNPEKDTLPERFTSKPLQEGASKGQVVPIQRMIEEYYRLRGWDEFGRPVKSQR